MKRLTPRVFGGGMAPSIATLVLMMILAFLPSVTQARDIGALGGGGGAEFRSVCRPNDVMIGFNMRSGSALDAIVPICIGLNPERTEWASSAYEPSGYFGGGGGDYQKIDCQPGYAVRHLHVYMDRFKIVNHIRMTCQDLNSGEWHNGTPAQIGGEAIGDVRFSCGDGEWGTGIYGRSGDLVDQLGLQCDRIASAAQPPPPPPPPPSAPHPPPPPPPVADTATTPDGTTIYKQPNGDQGQDNVVDYVQPGGQVTVVKCENGFCQISAPASGWVWGADIGR